MTRRLVSPKMLRLIMESRGATQKDLADTAGITQAAVGYYLQEPRDPSLKIVCAFANFLRVPVVSLLIEDKGVPADLRISTAFDLADRLDLPIGELQ